MQAAEPMSPDRASQLDEIAVHSWCAADAIRWLYQAAVDNGAPAARLLAPFPPAEVNVVNE
jgi:hypothetical protein